MQGDLGTPSGVVGITGAIEDKSPAIPPEHEYVPEAWSRGDAPPPSTSFLTLFAEQVARAPDAVALVVGGETLTYQALDASASRLASHLQRKGIGPEMLVGLCVERSPALIVGLLAILKAGGAFVPLDPAYPAERLSYMSTDSHLRALLTLQRLGERIPQFEGPVIYLDAERLNEEDLQEATSAPAPAPAILPEYPAYVIYTSGSTGRPKGVVVLHQGLGNLALAQREAFDVRPGRRVLQFASASFDAAISEVVMTLSAGATLCLGSADTLRPGRDLHDLLREQAISVATLPPTALAVTEPDSLSDLEILIAAGESCPASVVTTWEAGRRFFNAYGPTEASVCATIATCSEAGSIPPIGRPIPGVEVYVLDQHLRPAFVGDIGELYIGGLGLARGYLGRPDLTAERFLPHPFSITAGARLYRTGDLVRWRADGQLEFVGRVDQQIKLRGFRIELGEIEMALVSHPDVREAVVLAREDISGEKRLVAYVVATGEHMPHRLELRRHLQEMLPEYMIPASFVALAALPLLPNGKVDRRALPAPDDTQLGIDTPYTAPRTPIEEMLAGIWAEILGMTRVGIHDNFFLLGGHSLLAIQMIARVRQMLHRSVSVRSLFDGPTIAELAARIERHQGGSQLAALPPLQPASREGAIPLSFPQERVWFFEQLSPGNLAYNAQSRLRFTGSLHLGALERTLNEIIRRHEIFRTTFPALDGRPVQQIQPPWTVQLPVIDLSGLPDAARAATVEALVKEVVRLPFDLARLPLVRWLLLRISAHDHLLVHVEHHLVHDGWSFNVFLREFAALYTAFCRGEPSPLPEPVLQFADFALWQRTALAGEFGQSQLAYWRDKLAGAPPLLELPTDHPRPPRQTWNGRAIRIDLPLELCDALRSFSRRTGATLYITMLAAFAVLLTRYSGQEDLCIGAGMANRRWRETEGLIGMLISMVVLRLNLARDPTVRELLQRVREVTLDAHMHQDVPFEWIVDALQPKRDLSYNPIYQVSFSFNDTPQPPVDLPGLDVDVVEGISNDSAKWDLNVVSYPRLEQHAGQGSHSGRSGITVVWEYNTDLFDAGTIERISSHYQALLHALVMDPEQRIADLPLMSAAERDHMIVEWNATQTEYPHATGVHELVTAQAATRPDAIAVAFGDTQLSYGALERRANQLARYLRQLGVGPEIPVGVCLDRSVNLVVAVLGILKAGGAYLPLDPSYPPERLALMIADADAPVVVHERGTLDRLAGLPAQSVCLDTVWDEAGDESNDRQLAISTAGTGEQLCYVVYTSGSTGVPKGIGVPHRAVTRLVCNTDYVPLQSSDIVAQASNASFDAATFEIWGALIHGARLEGIPKDTLLSPPDLAAYLRSRGISVLFLTTALFNQVAGATPAAFNPVRHLLFGGEAVDPQRVRHILEEGGPARLLHVYGPTESTTFATWYQVDTVADDAATVPIGSALANTTLFVLDTQLQPVPIGVPGELYIGGDGLARGYVQRPELTAERFVPDPFSATPGARLYRTGDRVRWRPDGTIEFLERLDQQVKLRGFRIEPGEIEVVLNRHPAVAECVVLVREDGRGTKYLAAYVAGNRELAIPTVGELRSYLKEHLPEYMVPASMVVLNALPLTPNGKVDRDALPATEADSAEYAEVYVGPRTPVEEAVAAIWAEVLDRPQISIHTNFFDTGGHSLLATQIISRIRALLGVNLPLRCMFEAPTISQLAECVEQARMNGIPAPETAIPRVARDAHRIGAAVVSRAVQYHRPPATGGPDEMAERG